MSASRPEAHEASADITITQVTDPPAGSATFQRLLASEQLPAWLPQLLTTLYDGQHPDAATRWGQRVADSFEQAPFEVVHDWQARTVVPLILQACEPGTLEPEAPEPGTPEPTSADLRQLHARAADGERFGEAEWQAAIEPVLRALYRQAYGYAEAYATARASALAYAQANDFSESGAVEFADSYAKLSTDSNRKSYTEANAVANAAVLAAAYASGDAQAYAEAYPFALVHACAHACANQACPESQAEPATQADRSGPAGAGVAGAGAAGDEAATRAERRQAAYARLANGLAESLTRFR